KSGAQTEGYLSQCGSVTVRVVVKGKPHTLHLFVKRENAKEVVDGLDAFHREGLFYEKVLPHLEEAWHNVQAANGVSTAGVSSFPPAPPACRLAPTVTALRRPVLQDAESGEDTRVGVAAFLGTDTVVVMEDLTRRGYVAISDWEWNDIPYQTVEQSLHALARLHASTLVAERIFGVNLAAEVPELMDENFFTRVPGRVGRRIFESASEVWVRYVLPRVFSRLRVPQTADELRRLQDVVRDMYAQLDVPTLRKRETVRVVSNGDVWPNNVLVKHDAQGRVSHAIVVDFQMVHLGPPALDVLMYLLMTMRRSHRQRHADALLRDYHTSLLRFCRQRGLDLSEASVSANDEEQPSDSEDRSRTSSVLVAPMAVPHEFGWEAFKASCERVEPAARCIMGSHGPMIRGCKSDMDELFKDSEKRSAILLDADYRGALVVRWMEADPAYRELIIETLEVLLGLPASASAEQ
ncbi:Mitoferrin-1, partial [Frankliniella fusca]